MGISNKGFVSVCLYFQNVSLLEEAFHCVIVHNENTENERKENFFKQMSKYCVPIDALATNVT